MLSLAFSLCKISGIRSLTIFLNSMERETNFIVLMVSLTNREWGIEYLYF